MMSYPSSAIGRLTGADGPARVSRVLGVGHAPPMDDRQPLHEAPGDVRCLPGGDGCAPGTRVATGAFVWGRVSPAVLWSAERSESITPLGRHDLLAALRAVSL